MGFSLWATYILLTWSCQLRPLSAPQPRDEALPRQHRPQIAQQRQNATHLLVIMKANLPNIHTPILPQILRRRINNRHIIPLIPLNTIRLRQLRQILQQLLGQIIPRPTVGHAKVDVRAGQLVGVEPDVDVPGVGDEVLVLELVAADVDGRGGVGGCGGEVVDHGGRLSCTEASVGCEWRGPESGRWISGW